MKKLMSLVLILAIVITSGLVSLADSSVDFKEDDYFYRREKVEALAKEYGLIMLNSKSEEPDSTIKSSMMVIKSEKELIELISYLENEMNTTIVKESIIEVAKNSSILRADSMHERHYKNWAPYANGGLFCWENIFTKFYFKDQGGVPVFTSIISVDSDVTGVNALYSYTHASHVETFSNGNKTVEITTRGRAVFGVSIEGFDLGIPYTKYMTDKFTVVYE